MNRRLFVFSALVVVVCYSGLVDAKTRQEVANDAIDHEHIDTWTPTINTHKFADNLIFKSA